ncbi:MAG TPA: ATP-binding protein [Candidatus Solibacter sp.]|jgi:K+-sensing histidine kinase KdpD|nr:ATP-binding protein [Candidatus Solibacter sp.]
MIQGVRHQVPGYVVSCTAPLAVTLGILAIQQSPAASTGYSYLYLGTITLVALAFGLGPAIVAAVACTVLIDYFFVPPIGTFTISSGADIQNLLLFVIAALVVGILADTRRRQEHQSRELAESLRRSNEELERRRAEAEEGRRLATELAQVSATVEALAAADRLKSELLANVSHQLRTPLGAIVGMSSALLETDRVDVDEAARQYLDTINSEGRHLARLVDDLLEMARLESGVIELNLEPVDAREALESAADRARNLDPDLELTVTGEAGLALADDAGIQEILRNLIENASRYSKVVDLGCSPGDETVRFEVADRGPGVPEADREAIFDRFFQGGTAAEGSDHRPAGSGLGLAICRRLAEAMGGRIWCEARPGGGSKFIVAVASYGDRALHIEAMAQ